MVEVFVGSAGRESISPAVHLLYESLSCAPAAGRCATATASASRATGAARRIRTRGNAAALRTAARPHRRGRRNRISRGMQSLAATR